MALVINPATHYGDELAVDPPVEPDGRSHHLIVRRNATTVTDFRTPGHQTVFNEQRSCTSGATIFRLHGGSEWSAGGGDATLTLIGPTGVVEDTLLFTVVP